MKALLLSLCLSLAPAVASAEGLQRIKYNNPGLVVDLAVGLWAWPLPMDFNGDGNLDLLVSCPDKPFNGLYFFENASGSTAQTPLPIFHPARRISRGLQAAASLVHRQPPARAHAGDRVSRFSRLGLGKRRPTRAAGQCAFQSRSRQLLALCGLRRRRQA